MCIWYLCWSCVAAAASEAPVPLGALDVLCVSSCRWPLLPASRSSSCRRPDSYRLSPAIPVRHPYCDRISSLVSSVVSGAPASAWSLPDPGPQTPDLLHLSTVSRPGRLRNVSAPPTASSTAPCPRDCSSCGHGGLSLLLSLRRLCCRCSLLLDARLRCCTVRPSSCVCPRLLCRCCCRRRRLVAAPNRSAYRYASDCSRQAHPVTPSSAPSESYLCKHLGTSQGRRTCRRC